MISEALEKQKKEAASSSELPMNPSSFQKIIRPIIKERMEFKARDLKQYLVKRPKARCWEFKGSCSRNDNVKIMKNLVPAIRSSKNVRQLVVDYPKPGQGDWGEVTYSRNALLKYLSQSLKGQRSIKKASFDFQGFWADREVNEMGMYHLRRGLKSLASLKSLKLDCHKHPDITKNKAQKLSQALKTLGFLQDISLDFLWNEKLTDKGVENLAQDLKRLTCLQNIDIQFPSCKEITGTGFQKFGQLLAQLQLQTIHLDFSSCEKINDEGISCIGQGMRALTSLLHLKLKFQFSYKITNKGISDLAKGIQELPLLRSLDLNFWNFEHITNFDLAFAKLNSLQSLKLVFFMCRKLVGIRLLESQECFKGLTSLQKIDLRFVYCHEVADEALKSLGMEFAALASLQDIFLGFSNCNKLTDQGMEDFSKNLETLISLTKLELRFEECEGFTDTGLSFLSTGLEALCSLKDLKLNIPCPNFTPEGINHLNQIWPHLHLDKIDLLLPRSALNDAVIEDLGRSLNQITSLKNVIVEIGQGENVTKAGENSFFQALSDHQCLKNTEFRTSHPDDIDN